MGHTKRFLEMVDAEKDDYWDMRKKIEGAVLGLCRGEPEKTDTVLGAIWGLRQSARELYQYVWTELEPELKEEDSELLVFTKQLIALTLLSEVDKWITPKEPSA